MKQKSLSRIPGEAFKSARRSLVAAAEAAAIATASAAEAAAGATSAAETAAVTTTEATFAGLTGTERALALGLGLSFVATNGTAVEGRTVQSCKSLVSIFAIGESHESETAAAARVTIHHDNGVSHFAVSFKCSAQSFARGVPGESTDKQLHLNLNFGEPVDQPGCALSPTKIQLDIISKRMSMSFADPMK